MKVDFKKDMMKELTYEQKIAQILTRHQKKIDELSRKVKTLENENADQTRMIKELQKKVLDQDTEIDLDGIQTLDNDLLELLRDE